MVNLSSPIIGKNWREILRIYTSEKLAEETSMLVAAFAAHVPFGQLGEGSSVEVATADIIQLLERLNANLEGQKFRIVASIVEAPDCYGAALCGYFLFPNYTTDVEWLTELFNRFKDIELGSSLKGAEKIFSRYGNAIQMVELKGVDA